MRLFAFAVGPLITMSSLCANAGEPTREELKQQVKQLKAEIKKLSAVVEGTAKPINLGRTDFAAVLSSGANGGRSPGNKFYGVRNAFDGGENWHNNINYTYWLSGGGLGAFIEVRFDQPVSVTSVVVEGGPGCTPVFSFKKGGEEPHAAFAGEFKPAAPLHGVTGVKLSFGNGGGNIQVNEVRVMGYPHPKVKYKVTRPRLILNQRGAESIAVGQFEEAGYSRHLVNHRVAVHKDRWEIVFHHLVEKIDLFQVTVFKRDSRVLTKKLAKWTAIKK